MSTRQNHTYTAIDKAPPRYTTQPDHATIPTPTHTDPTQTTTSNETTQSQTNINHTASNNPTAQLQGNRSTTENHTATMQPTDRDPPAENRTAEPRYDHAPPLPPRTHRRVENTKSEMKKSIGSVATCAAK